MNIHTKKYLRREKENFFMKETAKGISWFLGSAFTSCVMGLFFVEPKSTIFWILLLLSFIVGVFWLIVFQQT
jgi:hypothetical protein